MINLYIPEKHGETHLTTNLKTRHDGLAVRTFLGFRHHLSTTRNEDAKTKPGPMACHMVGLMQPVWILIFCGGWCDDRRKGSQGDGGYPPGFFHISHLTGKGQSSSKCHFWWDMLVAWWLYVVSFRMLMIPNQPDPTSIQVLLFFLRGLGHNNNAWWYFCILLLELRTPHQSLLNRLEDLSHSRRHAPNPPQSPLGNYDMFVASGNLRAKLHSFSNWRLGWERLVIFYIFQHTHRIHGIGIIYLRLVRWLLHGKYAGRYTNPLDISRKESKIQNPLLLMEEILHQLIWRISHYLRGKFYVCQVVISRISEPSTVPFRISNSFYFQLLKVLWFIDSTSLTSNTSNGQTGWKTKIRGNFPNDHETPAIFGSPSRRNLPPNLKSTISENR